MGAFQVGHVFNDTDYSLVHCQGEIQGSSDVFDGDALRCRDHDDLHVWNLLHHRERFIPTSWRRVYQEKIEFSPFHISKELVDSGNLYRTAPYGRFPFFQKVRHGYHLEVFRGSRGNDPGAIHVWWRRKTGHRDHVWPVEVDIEKTDSVTFFG